jgi:hypothetical protein
LKTVILARYWKLVGTLGASCALLSTISSGCASPGPTPTNPEFLRVTCLYQDDHESCREYKSLTGANAKPKPDDRTDSEPRNANTAQADSQHSNANSPSLLQQAGDDVLLGAFIFVEVICMGCIR